MPTIAHLSDLHFGRETPEVVAALAAHLNAEPPDLTIVSGDFTQRARPEQFARAASFYFGLPEPRLAVAGNHDMPLWNFAARIGRPFATFQRHIVQTLRPTFDDDQLCVVGLNTPRRCSPRLRGFWKDGLIRPRDLDWACGVLAASRAPVKVCVMHHPLRVDHEVFDDDVVRGADRAAQALAAAGCDAVLYGHIHVPHVLVDVEPALQMPRAMICAMAGTATSDRRRMDAPNSYNRFWFDGDRCTAEVIAFDGKRFERATTHRFVRDAIGWRSAEPTADAPIVGPQEDQNKAI